MKRRDVSLPVDECAELDLVVPRRAGAQDQHDSARSPLRYPGGKTRAVNEIRQYLPADLERLCSPFLGGASVELACAAAGMRVYGADAFAPVINFWRQAKEDAVALAARVETYYPLSRARFYQLQKTYAEIADPQEQAVIFFVLNRSSFSGTTLSGGMSPGHTRFTPSAIDRLCKFRAANLFVRCRDYRQTLREHENTFLYLDPPYATGGRLYGRRGDMHGDFNHEELAAALRKRDGWILSYNDSREIRDLYQGYEQVRPQWTYGMSHNKQSRELLILNA